MNRRFLLACAAISAAGLTACSNQTIQPPIEGVWLQPVPGQRGALQGMDLSINGEARSVNMHTLLYKSWSKRGNRLTLSGMSIGNRTSSNFTSTYTIDQLTPERLVLKNGSEKQTYFRARK